MSLFLLSLATVSWPTLLHSESKETEEIAGRSPCPGLNALANQGYIPRDGRSIGQSQLYRLPRVNPMKEGSQRFDCFCKHRCIL